MLPNAERSSSRTSVYTRLDCGSTVYNTARLRRAARCVSLRRQLKREGIERRARLRRWRCGEARCRTCLTCDLTNVGDSTGNAARRDSVPYVTELSPLLFGTRTLPRLSFHDRPLNGGELALVSAPVARMFQPCPVVVTRWCRHGRHLVPATMSACALHRLLRVPRRHFTT